ncbi:MAG: M28 family peptidase, partial [Halodesulfurarchaeum sp.]
DRYARDARLEEFEIQGWERESARIETDAGPEEAIALPRSPGGTVSGELVDVGYGLPKDFEEQDLDGAIVMASSDVPDWYDRYIHRREKYFYAVDAGADGFIYRNHVEGCLPPTGSVGGADGPLGEIPTVGVSKEVGSRLARRAEGETVTMEVSVSAGEATSQNVHARLGPDTEREVLVTAHVDAHDIAEGAMDNGAGTAMVVEVAKALERREEELDTAVHFIVFGAEEVGLLGSSFDADRRNLDDIKTVLNFDGVVRARTIAFHTHGFDALESAARAVTDRYDHPIYVTPEQGPHSDHWPYVQSGVPGYHVMSHTAEEGRGWGHTYADTLDKLEQRTFTEQAILLTDLVVDLADQEFEVEHVSPEEIAEALEEEGTAEGMKVTGDWPY